MFFVLSGFLITYQYYDQIQFSFKHYMMKRFARIYPVYFILTSLFFIYLSVRKSAFTFVDLKLYLLNITFLKSFFYDFFQSGIAPGWSLNLEELFYVMVPALFLLMRRKVAYLLLVPVFFIFAGLLLVRLVGVYDFRGFFINDSFMFNYTIFGRISEFIAGIFLALLVRRYSGKITTKYSTYIGLGIIFVGVVLLSVKPDIQSDGFDRLPGKLLNTFLIPVFGTLPFYWGLITERTLLSRMFASKLFQFLGKSSYIFYLIHIWFLIVIKDFGFHFYFLEFALVNLISIVLYYSLEKPLNNYFRRRFLPIKKPAVSREPNINVEY